MKLATKSVTCAVLLSALLCLFPDQRALAQGTVSAWGHNGYGELGNGTYTTSNMPVQVSDLSGVTSSFGGGVYHSVALKGDGTVWTWGDNSFGQLGNGTYTGSEATTVWR
jgi:alpha-tubulin suppressor-like RCC1 family protein